MATSGGAESSSGPGKRQVEDLGRYVDPIQPHLLTITSDTRILRNIESAVRERAKFARDSKGDYPGPTNECIVFWRTEILERLGALDVCGFQLTMPSDSQLPQEDLEQGGALEIGEMNRQTQWPIDVEPSAPASVTVRCRLVASAPYSLLTIYST